ncbi:uncharacterized protein BROUX77_007018 [Berkeleyomyces rouxiae]|uniref:uncharacterized protein n=1 Tax=Berkeleyomyces rouxiae TaxID=2035830 RepID=UPI003B811B23
MENVKTPEAVHKVMGYYKKAFRFSLPPSWYTKDVSTAPYLNVPIYSCAPSCGAPTDAAKFHFEAYNSVSPRNISFPDGHA